MSKQDITLESNNNIVVIIPAFNAHNTIKRTLSSIAMQDNIDEIETIIVDDCSSRDYEDIAKKFSHMMKIKIVRMLENGGPGVARQVGVDNSTAPFITFIDADDCFISCDALETLKNAIINKDQDVVYGQFLEQVENNNLILHEVHMIWVFGKLYRRSFLEQFNIRFNVSCSNEDTGFNSLVRGCTNRIYYIQKPVYTWRFKDNSITRINQGMYKFESGYKGYIDNMIWYLKELDKRFVNRNFILDETISILNVLYNFHVENLERYPMNKDISMNWIRGFYSLCYKDIEEYITPARFNEISIGVHKDQNIFLKGIVPRISVNEFIDEIKKADVVFDESHEIRGATPVCYIPETTPTNWAVETLCFYNTDVLVSVDSNTNLSRYEGMNKAIGKG